MTAAAAFPPCCWSMTAAHDHQAQQEDAPIAVPSHDHHHHGSPEPAAPPEALAVSAVPAHDCDTQAAEAIATPRLSRSSIEQCMAIAAPAPFTMPHASAARAGLTDFSPPGTLVDSAFLHPLRV